MSKSSAEGRDSLTLASRAGHSRVTLKAFVMCRYLKL